MDIHTPREVEWAVTTRVQADRDLIIISGAQGSKLDPSTDNGVGAKLGIDATVPLGALAGNYKRIRVPGEETVDLNAVIDTGAGDNWRG